MTEEKRPDSGLKRVPMRELTRATSKVLEEAIRSGKPILVTMFGTPQVMIVSLTAHREEIPLKIFTSGIPEDVMVAIRNSDAEMISGRAYDAEDEDERDVSAGKEEVDAAVASRAERNAGQFLDRIFLPDADPIDEGTDYLPLIASVVGAEAAAGGHSEQKVLAIAEVKEGADDWYTVKIDLAITGDGIKVNENMIFFDYKATVGGEEVPLKGTLHLPAAVDQVKQYIRSDNVELKLHRRSSAPTVSMESD